jgi:non-ribosomal peptide synthetase component F
MQTPSLTMTAPIVRPDDPGRLRKALRLRRLGKGERRRTAVADGLVAVARRSGPRARGRRHGELLVHRAAAVRPQLLELSAMLRSTSDPDRGTIEMLRVLLIDGCTSPLFNPDVPAERLSAVLTQARLALTAAGAPRGRFDAASDARPFLP